jgi:hypothetical protein
MNSLISTEQKIQSSLLDLSSFLSPETLDDIKAKQVLQKELIERIRKRAIEVL